MIKNNKILILTGIFPPDIGGPIAQIAPLTNELIKNGYEVNILTYGEEDNDSYNFNIKKISNKKLFKNLIYLLNGLSLAFRSDIIYSWDLYSAGLTGLAIKKLLGRKVINRFAGDSAWEKAASKKMIGNDDVLVFQDKKYSKKIEFWKNRRKRILMNSDKVIVVSNFLKKIAIKIGVPEEKIKVIYNSVDVIDVNRADNSSKCKEIILLTAARLMPWKGVDMLIEIMPDLISKYNKIKLVIVGDGPELRKLRFLVEELKLENYIIFKGKITRLELIDNMNMADLFLLNTNYEGMSHTILEAMKVGVPVITTNIGGNPEIIIDKQTGLLLNYRDMEQWILAISMILDDPDLVKKFVNNAKDSLKKFNWKNLIKETIDVFKNIYV
ncbi:glycosyltransferase family 4 protein [Patescibacteria group bacterium]